MSINMIKYKTYNFEEVNISSSTLKNWKTYFSSILKGLINKYPDLQDSETNNIVLRVYEKGDAEIYINIRGVAISMEISNSCYKIKN